MLQPIDWCVLAEICNHTWVPECGLERDEQYYRLFLDECDMFEYNCDNGLNFEIVNYSECFGSGPCPPVKPCPSVPPCPNHAMHRMNDHYFNLRRSVAPTTRRRTSRTPPPNLPYHMLHGKRRWYTPNKPKRRHREENYPPHISKLLDDAEKYQQQHGYTTVIKKRQTKPMRTKPRRTTANWKTKIIKTNTFMKNGKWMVRIVRGINKAHVKKKTTATDSSGFLE